MSLGLLLSKPRRYGQEGLVVLLLFAAGWCIYGQTLAYPFISFDDPGYVVQNANVNHGLTWEDWKWAWTSFAQSNWHPLTWLSLMLDAQLYGLSAGGYHLTNLLLHLTSGALIFRWLHTATRALWPSALTAFFFVTHPLHVESVAWVTERKDVLSTLFFCLMLLTYTHYAKGGGRRFYWVSAGLFALGLTAKPMLVTVPPLLLLLDYWPLKRQGIEWWKLWLEKTPFFVLAAASCVVTLLAQRGDALVPLESLPLGHRAASAALSYGTYLTMTLWPVNLGIYYPYWSSQSIGWPIFWAATLGVMTLIAFRVRRTLPFVVVGWGWFVGTLVPVIGVVQVGGQSVADRYTYLPHIGLFIVLFWTGATWWKYWGETVRFVALALTAVTAAAAVAASYQQTRYWRNSATLFEHTASVVRPSARLYFLLGNAEIEANQPTKATEAFLQAWRRGTTGDETIRPLGTLLLNAGRWQEAVEVLAPARDRRTATADMLNDLALALVKTGRDDEAQIVYQRCVERFPNFALARFGWAELLQSRGWVADAATQDTAGLSLHGDWPPALKRLAWNYAHSPDPAARENGLALAHRAATVTDGHDLGSLNVLAYAEAVNGEWNAAVDAAARALEAAQRPEAPASAAEDCRKSLELYRQRQLPP